LFVSVDLDDLGNEVAGVQERFEGVPGLNLTDPHQAHVTMRFVGDRPADDLPAITEAVERAVAGADVAPFEAEFAGLGVFPHPGYIRVVWLGVRDGSDELTALHEAVEAELVDLGLDPEDHEFTPHVTLARMEHAGGKDTVQAALSEPAPEAGRMTVSEVRLTESTLTDRGPIYETVERFGLWPRRTHRFGDGY
jgi:2'-5' RNA ligase